MVARSDTIERIQQVIQDHTIQMIDLKFTDLRGKQHHISVPPKQLSLLFEEGKYFDGSSIAGWKGIEDSDMLLVPDPDSLVLEPFYAEKTASFICHVIDPGAGKDYLRDPRAVARRAEIFLKNSGVADKALFGPEPEFCVFDDVRWKNEMSGAFYAVDSEEASWNTGKTMEGGNVGHRPNVKGGYFPLPPVDSAQDLRTAIAMTLTEMGLEIEAHHHEVASTQNEVAVRYNTLVKKADELQLFKHVVRNVAHAFGKTATFMAKPMVGDNGSGMHCHQSLQKAGKNIFAGDAYAGLSETALYYIGGIIRHARALNAFTNPGTNSYKRLVPGFEAPVLLAYAARNRSAAIRIPQANHPQAKRIEVRFPDPTANPYLAFSAMVMAGLDGIKNKINPGIAIDKDLYELSSSELKEIPSVCASLEQALDCLEQDHAFLLAGEVFNVSLLEGYIALKQKEITRLRMSTHPIEFELYYSD